MTFSIQTTSSVDNHHVNFKRTALDAKSGGEDNHRVSSERIAQHTNIKVTNGSVEPYIPNIQMTNDMIGKAFNMTDLNAEERELYHQQSTKDIISGIDLTNTNPSDFNMAILALSYRGEIPQNEAGVMAATVSMDQNLKGISNFNAIEYFKGVSIGGYDKTGYTSQGLKTLQSIHAAREIDSDLLKVDMKV